MRKRSSQSIRAGWKREKSVSTIQDPVLGRGIAILNCIDSFLHLDKHIAFIANNFGFWAYPLLFMVIFAETGFVVTPFLPGDSFLFMVGTIAALGLFNIWVVFIMLILAAILGDNLNYLIGKIAGPKVFKYEKARFFKKENLEVTRKFYCKHGPKTVILARFFPIIRTFAPFVAGIGRMHYPKFLFYDIIGGVIWVSIFIWGGFYFGRIPFVKNNFTLVIITIIFVSFLPIIIKSFKSLSQRLKANGTAVV